MKLLTRDRLYYRMAARLIFPIAFQNALFLVVNMLDTIMLGKLGSESEAAISAAGLASQPFFVLSLFIFGTVSGSSVLVAQYWGRNDTDSINSIAGSQFPSRLSSGRFPRFLSRCFRPGSQNLFVGRGRHCPGYGISQDHRVFLYPHRAVRSAQRIMRSVERVKCALYSSMIGLFVNLILNYCLIFGKLGFPRMEIRGAAIATVIARVFELMYVIWYVFIHDKTINIRLAGCSKFLVCLFVTS